MYDSLNILVVEDDKNTGFLLEKRLLEEGFQVTLCKDGEQGLNAFRENDFNLCVLDIMLPSKDGLELGKDIHALNSEIPIIFLTARSLKQDKILGYKNGCDDYITKPFDIDELMFKIKAILKRSSKTKVVSKKLTVAGLTLLKEERLLISEGNTASVSHKEMLLIELFFNHFQEVIPRKQLLMTAWGNDDYFSSKILDVYLTKIRKLLKMDASLKLQNIHGHGYKLIKSA